MLKNIALEENEKNFNWTHESMYQWWNPPQCFEKLNKLKWVHKIKQNPSLLFQTMEHHLIIRRCGVSNTYVEGLLWRSWKQMENHMPKYKRFMVDNVQVNWNVVWIVFTHLEIHPNHCPIRNELGFSIWFKLLRSTPIDLFGGLIWGQNTCTFATTIRMPKHLMRQLQNLRSWGLGGIHLV